MKTKKNASLPVADSSTATTPIKSMNSQARRRALHQAAPSITRSTEKIPDQGYTEDIIYSIPSEQGYAMAAGFYVPETGPIEIVGIYDGLMPKGFDAVNMTPEQAYLAGLCLAAAAAEAMEINARRAEKRLASRTSRPVAAEAPPEATQGASGGLAACPACNGLGLVTVPTPAGLAESLNGSACRPLVKNEE